MCYGRSLLAAMQLLLRGKSGSIFVARTELIRRFQIKPATVGKKGPILTIATAAGTGTSAVGAAAVSIEEVRHVS
jgi:hypothetical protein